jgi:hypothetical protein
MSRITEGETKERNREILRENPRDQRERERERDREFERMKPGERDVDGEGDRWNLRTQRSRLVGHHW